MENIAKLRIHIAPVGFEIDRVVMAAISLYADKVILLVHDKSSEDKAIPFVKKIETALKAANIKVEYKKHDRLDLFNIIKSIKEIIEKENKNDIYVNLASGSKLQAIGGMMASMMFNNQNVHPFYAEAEDYPGFKGKQQSTGVKDINIVPTYEVHIPKQELIAALKIIKDRGGEIQKKEMVRLAEDNQLIVVKPDAKNPEISRYASLDKNIIKPLIEQWHFLEEEKKGRARYIKITKEGLDASEFLT